jgi:SAM-dependent methyltransferase
VEQGDGDDVTTSAPPDVVAESVATYADDVDAFVAFSANAVAAPFAAFATHLASRSTVLDAGCGPGRDLARLAALGHQGVGVDLHPPFVQRAGAHAPTVVGDLRRLPFASASFDAVWASASLIHLPFDDAAAALGELARVARTGATVGVSVKVAGVTGWADDPPRGRRWFSVWTPVEFTDAVESVGLSVEEVIVGQGWVGVTARA